MTRFKQFLNEDFDALVVDEKSRAKLQELFPPKFSEFIGHHITLKFPVKSSDEIPPPPSELKVVGRAEEDGLEALVVSVDGETARKDGSTYHITWSLDRHKGKKPVHSKLLVSRGWDKVNPPIQIHAKFNRLK